MRLTYPPSPRFLSESEISAQPSERAPPIEDPNDFYGVEGEDVDHIAANEDRLLTEFETCDLF